MALVSVVVLVSVVATVAVVVTVAAVAIVAMAVAAAVAWRWPWWRWWRRAGAVRGADPPAPHVRTGQGQRVPAPRSPRAAMGALGLGVPLGTSLGTSRPAPAFDVRQLQTGLAGREADPWPWLPPHALAAGLGMACRLQAPLIVPLCRSDGDRAPRVGLVSGAGQSRPPGDTGHQGSITPCQVWGRLERCCWLCLVHPTGRGVTDVVSPGQHCWLGTL